MLATLSLAWSFEGLKNITVEQAISQCQMIYHEVRSRGYLVRDKGKHRLTHLEGVNSRQKLLEC